LDGLILQGATAGVYEGGVFIVGDAVAFMDVTEDVVGRPFFRHHLYQISTAYPLLPVG
jgi:hypothetical protein